MANKQVRQLFQEWYKSDLGRSVLERELSIIEQQTEGSVGYFAVIQSPLIDLPLSKSHIRNQIMLAPIMELGASKNTIIGLSNELPLDSDGVDVHIMHHSLDLSEAPHDDVREAARTLLPSGRVVIIGFNPWSLWGGRKMASNRLHAPWCSRFISPKRLEDWLKVAGLTLDSVEYICFRPPVRKASWYQSVRHIGRALELTHLPLGGVYIISATKQVRRHIAIKPRWKRAKVRVPSITKPIVKEMQD
ncbi:SAM-dependent methyltransferase [Marinomonas sp. 15G1-11]|uniref:SAM-dependent methyltransferase n=1 Tax=Marinomonas phaeophyticola TaxID=3004091 RepID=A0ABT4JWP0_9GAMM|nr:SAM-dependent methyltransferase [Marinomonas sp. 15G1-11]MCZ2722787.1 SAM-dependent methyltransferase [Marinomonas sp. 15G1-11]